MKCSLLLKLLPVLLLCSCTAGIERTLSRLQIPAPAGVYKLFRSPDGPLSQQEILKTARVSTVLSFDSSKHLITIRTPGGEPLTVSADAASFPFQRLRIGMPVLVRAYVSTTFSVVAADAVDLHSPQRVTELTREAKSELPDTAIITGIDNTILSVRDTDEAHQFITLERPDGSRLKFPVRYMENFKRVRKGDTVALTKVEAISIHQIPGQSV